MYLQIIATQPKKERKKMNILSCAHVSVIEQSRRVSVRGTLESPLIKRFSATDAMNRMGNYRARG